MVIMLVGMSTLACATPSPIVTEVSWDNYTDPDGIGMLLYWKKPSTALYTDTDREDIGMKIPEVQNIRDANPGAKATLCFVLTVYDAAGNESAYSNEACGWTGIPSPQNNKVK